MELLKTDGATALARAKDRFETVDQQSGQISDISREARAQVEKLEKLAEESKQNAKDANTKASQAYELAKNTLSQQHRIRDELRSNIQNDIDQSRTSLNNVVKLTEDALERANQIYDEALTLIANVNSLNAPDIDLDKLRKDALNAIEEVITIKLENVYQFI